MVGVSKLLSCKACRQSRKKCDQQKPICTRCRNTGLLCEWYEGSRFRFVGPSAQTAGPVERPRGTIEEDAIGTQEVSDQPRMSQNVNIPMELSLRPHKKPAEELGSVYPTLVANFVNLISIPCSMIGPSLSGLNQGSVQDSSLIRPVTVVSYEQIVRDCSNHEHMIWALLSALVCRSNHCDTEYDQSLVNFIVGRAIEALNADISRHGSLNPQHLQAMRYLSAAEVYRRDFRAATVHLQAARKMLDSYTSEQEHYTRDLSSMFTRADIVVAGFTLEKPIFPDIYDPGPPEGWLARELYDLADKPALQLLGSSLLTLPENMVPPVLAQIIEDVRTTTAIVAIDPNVVSSSTLAGCWLSARCDALHHRIWSIDVGGAETRAIQFALICWVTVIQNPLSAAKLMAEPLRRTLEEQELNEIPAESPFRNAIVWMLFFGAMVELNVDASTWWMDELSAVVKARSPEFQTRDQLFGLLREHFLFEAVHKDGIDAVMLRLYGDILEQ